MARIGRQERPCPSFQATVALKSLSGRWKVPILTCLTGGPLRYSALRAQLPGISHKMLAQQLTQLEEEGLLLRDEIDPNPPKVVEYCLSPLETELRPTLLALAALGETLQDAQSGLR